MRSLRRTRLVRLLGTHFPSIPPSDYPAIFPLYTPQDLDIVIQWSTPDGRSGHSALTDLIVGPQHGALNSVVARMENGGSSTQVRSMYAETTREREALLQAIRTSHWNVEEDPVSVHVKAPQDVKHDFSKGYGVYLGCEE